MVVRTPLTTTLRMVLGATALLAIIAALFAATLIPNGVSRHIKSLYWSNRVVAHDDQLATYRIFFSGFVPDHNA